jgi:putative membrane protein
MNLVRRWLFRAILLVVFLVVMVAASENSTEVSLVFIDYRTPEWPVAWWMLSAFVAGLFLGSVLNLFSNTKLRLKHRVAEKKVVATTRELDQVRATSAPDQQS